MKKDLRIRLIKNIKNRKILYSKSIGALNSNGEYIIELDQDDMFIRENAFQILYSEAKAQSLDLVQMRDFFKNEFHFKKRTIVNRIGLHYIYSKNTHYKIQPELKDQIFTENNNYLLWGLLIPQFPCLIKIIQ
jgi:glycosyltransferase involved in cell wall biosynthesis